MRNLREARKVDDEKELLAIRVTVLESDMSKENISLQLHNLADRGASAPRLFRMGKI